MADTEPPSRGSHEMEEEAGRRIEEESDPKKMADGSDSEGEEESDDVEITVTKPDDEEEEDDEVYEMSRTPSPVDLMDDTPMMRKKSAQPPSRRSPSPERSPSPVEEEVTRKVSEISVTEEEEVSERKISERKISERKISERKVSERKMSDVADVMPAPRSPTPERKDSRGSHGSSSYDEERASSLSPEPPKVIQTPSSANASPVSPPSGQSKSALTKIYTEALGDSDTEERKEKVVRSKPASDITQIYTQKLTSSPASSPKPERKDIDFKRPEGMTNITQLYTAAFQEKTSAPNSPKLKPMRNGDITKLYTGGLGNQQGAFKGKPRDEFTNPTKHNLATSVDKAAIQEAYLEVMGDKNGIEWAAFTFADSKLGLTAKGEDFDEFKTHFGPDDRGFGYIKIMTGDEMSKRSKFLFLTWVGPNVSVMKKAKMSTDKALLKEIITNLSVELQVETAGEFTLSNFKNEVDKAGGARYGTGVRD